MSPIAYVAAVLMLALAFLYIVRRRPAGGNSDDLPARIGLPLEPSDRQWFGFACRDSGYLYVYFEDGRYYLGYERPVDEDDEYQQQFAVLVERSGLNPETCERNGFVVTWASIESGPEQIAEMAFRFSNGLFGTPKGADLHYVP